MLEQIEGKYQVTAKEKRQKETILTINNQVVVDDLLPVRLGGNSFRYVKNKKYIPFIGAGDNLPNLLLELRLTSSTHNACIDSIAKAVIGKGVIVRNNDNPNKDFVTWMKSVNKQNQSLNRVLRSICEGERTQGNQFIEIVRGEIAGKKFLKIYPHSMLFCRLNNPDDSDPNAVIITKQFSKKGYTYIKDDMLQIPLWSANEIDQNDVWWTDKNGFQHTMLHFKNEVADVEYYGMPASYSTMQQVLLESKIARYNIDNFDNNMILGGMLIFKSAMSREEAEENAREILMQHVGEGKTGRIAVVSSESGAEDVQFIPFNTQKEGSFIEFDKRNEEKIISGHQWDSILAGINRDSNFGTGSQYIRSIWDIKEATLLNPYRNDLRDEVLFPIQQIYSEWFTVPEIMNYDLWFQPSMPFSFLADLNPEKFMKVGQAQELSGLQIDDMNKDKYLIEMKANVQSTENTTQDADNNR